jgi:hypothetical protein
VGRSAAASGEETWNLEGQRVQIGSLSADGVMAISQRLADCATYRDLAPLCCYTPPPLAVDQIEFE